MKWFCILAVFFFIVVPTYSHHHHDECLVRPDCDDNLDEKFRRILSDLHHAPPMPYPSIPPYRSCVILTTHLKLKRKSHVCKKDLGKTTTVRMQASEVIMKCLLHFLPTKLLLDLLEITNVKRHVCLARSVLQELSITKKLHDLESKLGQTCKTPVGLLSGFNSEEAPPAHHSHHSQPKRQKRFLPLPLPLPIPFQLPKMPDLFSSLPISPETIAKQLGPEGIAKQLGPEGFAKHLGLGDLESNFGIEKMFQGPVDLINKIQQLAGLEGQITYLLKDVNFTLTHSYGQDIGNVTVQKLSLKNVKSVHCKGALLFEQVCHCISQQGMFRELFLHWEEVLFPCYFKGTLFSSNRDYWSWVDCKPNTYSHHHHHY